MSALLCIAGVVLFVLGLLTPVHGVPTFVAVSGYVLCAIGGVLIAGGLIGDA